MESETFEKISETFREINIDDEQTIEKHKKYIYNPMQYSYKPEPKLPRIQTQRVEFEEYVKNNCKNKFQILNRETFYQIKKPIVIFFNHFREKCVYHTKWLDRIYELALRYGECIEFIAADMIDMDVMYPKTNPFNFFCRIVRSKDESPNTYAIDEQKRIYELHDAYYTLETLSELCENLLKGTLFPSLPIPENNDQKLVKICVHHNYKELILKSTKNIFLIINLDKYQYSDYEPNYDNVALALKDYNLDIIYMEAETNYIPFEYNAGGYPTILYIPHNDKKNFVYYNGMRKEADIIEYLKNMERPQYLLKQQQALKSTMLCKTTEVPKDFHIEFKDLSAFLEKNFDEKFKILDRQLLEKTRHTVIIVFMDFQNKCLKHHNQWLNKINQVVERAYTFQFLIADFKDIDVINTRWQPKDLIESLQGKPKIFGLDRLKHTYELENFGSIAQLFYFTESVQNGDFYYTQLYPRNNLLQEVKEWTADRFHVFLKAAKKNIFITFYSSEDKKAETLFDLLDSLALDVKELNVEVVKFDVKWNYVDLEYAQPVYPAQYFIPKENKRESRIYNGNCLDREEILKFIENNVK